MMTVESEDSDFNRAGGTIGATRVAIATPLFGPLQKKNGNIFKPRYVCTSDSSIHVNIVVVSAVLVLDTILTDTKGVVFLTHSQMQTEGMVFRKRSQMQVAVLSELRPMTIGLLLHARLTESTSNTDLHAREHFQ